MNNEIDDSDRAEKAEVAESVLYRDMLVLESPLKFAHDRFERNCCQR